MTRIKEGNHIMTTNTAADQDAIRVAHTFNGSGNPNDPEGRALLGREFAKLDYLDLRDGSATADNFQPGDVVAVYSRGRYRAALVEKVGRVNVTVAYSTPGAVAEAARYHPGFVNVTRKAVKFSEVAGRQL